MWTARGAGRYARGDNRRRKTCRWPRRSGIAADAAGGGCRPGRAGRVWTADLSGGVDSTSLCFLAAEAGAEVVALTLKLSDPGNEDSAYARQVAAQLPARSVHLTFTAADLPPI
ncbi:hypothetical protein FCH28_30480 [Streptomyces piniterrae]|uniref:Asparagine synthetase domain-containing protein n=1 Tax=Streptomyces piniterrae TaxID=2571125 RepID=A0A4U0MUL7_9ACTN|nr:asparagine synthase-related protein [Streptomyces piniterrae]TJZ44633.1 hypothetical protein FCH28_30480 [Streptomyces piniterrae]